MKNKGYLTPSDLAELFMVSPITIRQWAQKGWLKSISTVGGHRRFLLDDVEHFAKERNLSFASPSSAKSKILIVDDDRILCDFLSEFIMSKSKHVEIKHVHDGFLAGLMVLKFNPKIILLDILLPGLNGIDVCGEIKSEPATKDILVIAITGQHDESVKDKVIKAGADYFLTKPLDLPRLSQIFTLNTPQDCQLTDNSAGNQSII